MPIVFRNVTKISALALIAGLAVGCATPGDVAAVRAEAQRAMATANEARTTAENAQRTANQALQTANEARTMSMETDEKIDRMLRRAMLK